MITAKVLRRAQQATDIVSFELGRQDGGPLPPFSAGSHIDVETPNGPTRQYSLCNDPAEQDRYRIAVLREPQSRGGSVAMHEHVREGDTLRISDPRNHFPLVNAKRSLMFAGGIGVTPLLCMAQRLHTISADFTLHYSCRSPDRAAFRDEIAMSPFSPAVRFHFDQGAPEQKLDAAAVLANPDASTHLYVCGPSGYIDFIVQTATRLGWPPGNIHLEYFAAAPRDASGDQPFQVKLAGSGAVYDVAADQTVTQALAAHGVEIPVSCEQGVCGTCITRVLAGECDHRDLYFTDAEKARNDQFTPCCSRARCPILVLDL